jgi:hypothetical protein
MATANLRRAGHAPPEHDVRRALSESVALQNTPAHNLSRRAGGLPDSILSGLDDGEGNGTPNNNVLDSDEVDARRALCVAGATLTVKHSSGCSVAQGAGARTHEHTTR